MTRSPDEIARLSAEAMWADDNASRQLGMELLSRIESFEDYPVLDSGFESSVPGLFFVGEVVDVTGWLGGYNFQWAWASGAAAGNVA